MDRRNLRMTGSELSALAGSQARSAAMTIDQQQCIVSVMLDGREAIFRTIVREGVIVTAALLPQTMSDA